MNIENDRFVYYSPYDNTSVNNLINTKLLDIGFQKKQIIDQQPAKFAQLGDYLALFMPSNDGIDLIIGKIKKGRIFTGLKPLIDLPTEFVEYDTMMRINVSDELKKILL